MTVKPLRILAMLATIIAAAVSVYTVFKSNAQSPAIAQSKVHQEGSQNCSANVSGSQNTVNCSPVANSGPNISPGGRVKQESTGDNSPNIISGGNVTIGK